MILALDAATFAPALLTRIGSEPCSTVGNGGTFAIFPVRVARAYNFYQESVMATVMGENPYAERRIGERRRVAFAPAYNAAARTAGFDGLRVSWGGVWAGVLVALGGLALLSALGVAVGETAINPSSSDPDRIITVAGIWGAVSLLASLFIGGMVATRVGMVYDRAAGMFEGVLVWVVAMLLTALFAGSGLVLVPDFSINLGGGKAAAWLGLAAMLLSLLAAVGGAMAGRKGAAARVGKE